MAVIWGSVVGVGLGIVREGLCGCTVGRRRWREKWLDAFKQLISAIVWSVRGGLRWYRYPLGYSRNRTCVADRYGDMERRLTQNAKGPDACERGPAMCSTSQCRCCSYRSFLSGLGGRNLNLVIKDN